MTDRSSGHTLVEALVALTLGALVAAGVVTLLIHTTRLAQSHPDQFELHQRARVALDLITRDLRMAGAGVDRGPATGALVATFPAVWPRRIGRHGDAATTVRGDGFTVVAVPDSLAQTTAAAVVSPSDATVTVIPAAHCTPARPACGFSEGTPFGVFDGTGLLSLWTTDQVTGSVLSSRSLAAAHEVLPVGAVVSELLVRGYLHDPVTRQLRYVDAGSTNQPVIDGVTAMTVRYFDAAGELPLAQLGDGPWRGSGATMFDVDLWRVVRVRVELTLAAGRQTYRASADVTPRNLGGRS